MAVEPVVFPQGADVYCKGTFHTATMEYPDNSIVNADVNSAAAIDASKLEHIFDANYSLSGTAASVTHVLYEARAAGTILSFRAGSVAIAVGAATVTADLKKNGTTCLSAVITLDSANTAYIAEAATLSVTSYVAGDVFTLVTVATAGGGTIPTGFFAHARFEEAYV